MFGKLEKKNTGKIQKHGPSPPSFTQTQATKAQHTRWWMYQQRVRE